MADPARVRAILERAVARRVPRWLASEADDIVQLAMLRVMRAPGMEYNRSYLARVAATTVIDEIRRRARRDELPQYGETEVDRVDPRPDPERVARFGQLCDVVQECLAGLTVKRRAAVALYLEGHSVPEAARRLGWPSKQAENQVYRGLKDLRQAMVQRGWGLSPAGAFVHGTQGGTPCFAS